jgi:hypothetical protein
MKGDWKCAFPFDKQIRGGRSGGNVSLVAITSTPGNIHVQEPKDPDLPCIGRRCAAGFRSRDKLKEMQALFTQEAKKYDVYPLQNSSFARAIMLRPSATAARPSSPTRV